MEKPTWVFKHPSAHTSWAGTRPTEKRSWRKERPQQSWLRLEKIAGAPPTGLGCSQRNKYPMCLSSSDGLHVPPIVSIQPEARGKRNLVNIRKKSLECRLLDDVKEGSE